MIPATHALMKTWWRPGTVMMGTRGLTDRKMELSGCYRGLSQGRKEMYYHRIMADAIEARLGNGE